MEISKIVSKIATDLDSDIFLYSGSINQTNTDNLILAIRKLKKHRKNAILILTTLGGIADQGYRMVRFIKRKYEKMFLYVFGDCKSAGTLVAVGADEIVMSDFGEFGPLDVQLSKDDEMTGTSGLNYIQSLLIMREQAYSLFESSFMSLKKKFTITTKTAADISSSLAVGILSPISNQIDPIKLGEVQRSIRIAQEYGSRLIGTDTHKDKIVSRLISEYPSHSFVIDYQEAKELFGDIIREPNADERYLEQGLFNLVREEGEKPRIFCLSDIFIEDTSAEPNNSVDGDNAPSTTDSNAQEINNETQVSDERTR